MTEEQKGELLYCPQTLGLKQNPPARTSPSGIPENPRPIGCYKDQISGDQHLDRRLR